MKELELKNVNKEYKLGNKEKFRALTDINVSFDKGELVSIVGESGSGKSTLMNLIGGLDSDFSGDIVISGQNIQGLKDKDLDRYRKNKIGFVFQSFNLIPHLSILDNVTIALTLSGVKESERVQKATEILKKVGLEAQLKKKPNQLSGGQKQRVAIARALINDPDIILADEPTGALDSLTTLQILDLLKQIADEGKLVIMVTHSEKVASISSRVIEISDGKIIRDEKNENYKKNASVSSEVKHQKKEKQNLSFGSAIRLAFHNMWASKTKNILMSIGVAISIASLILMLSFASGLTGYISNLAAEYSSPTIVSISKRSASHADMSNIAGVPFTDEDVTSLMDEINNNPLKDSTYKVTRDKISYGYMAMTGFSGSASLTYKPEDDHPQTEKIFALYTTPATYSNSNLLKGEMSGENEVMFSAALIDKFGDDIVGKDITIKFNYSASVQIIKTLKVTGIVDVSMFSSMFVMYIDYDFLDKIVFEETTAAGEPTHISPTTVYITTDNQKTTSIINDYIKSNEKYSGSIEERLANMFTSMLNTFGLALTIIAGISLIVAAIMILVVLYISVTQRTKEIGVLKSIGARKRDIKLIFTSESFLIGVLSGLIGCILSILFILLIKLILTSALGFAPITLHWYYLLISFGVAILISMLSGLYPSSKAAKLDPVESLRHE